MTGGSLSVLDLHPGPLGHPPVDRPEFFRDLHLDDIEAAVTAGREAYDLAPFFRSPLNGAEAIRYRHEVFRDVGEPAIHDAITAFAEGMALTREHLGRAARLHVELERQRWFLDAAAVYRQAVEGLRSGLAAAGPRSQALCAVRTYLEAYVTSARFTALVLDIDSVGEALAAVSYRLTITGGQVRVRRFEGEPDYGAEVLAAFERFSQGATERRTVRSSQGPDMDHVEAAILDRVALLYPAPFAALEAFCAAHREFLDPGIARLDREIQFYLAYLDYLAPIRSAGLPTCYPEVSEVPVDLAVRSGYDLALARVRLTEGGGVVTNDAALTRPERILVVTGPNQGGKTTFARMVGQIHYLASIGCPVPASQADVPLVDQVFTQFEREEDLQEQSGKLEDHLRRIHRILDRATARSLLIMNESFASTTLEDALLLSTAVLRAIVACGSWCVTVTFLDELASLGTETVSLVGLVDPADPTVRTFKIMRRPADGLAYALAVAEKHGLTYRQLTGRGEP